MAGHVHAAVIDAEQQLLEEQMAVVAQSQWLAIAYRWTSETSPATVHGPTVP